MSFSEDPVYNKIISNYFGDTTVVGQEVWSRYKEYVQPWMESAPTFVAYLQRYLGNLGTDTPLSAFDSVTSFPTTGSYAMTLYTYFDYRSSDDKLAIWKAFLASEGYDDVTRPLDATLESQSFQNLFKTFVQNLAADESSNLQNLQKFVQQYNSYGFDANSLQMSQVTSIPTGFYSTYLHSFFGGRNAVELLDLWRAFLTSVGYPKQIPGNPPIFSPGVDELFSSSFKQAFVNYVEAQRARELRFEETTSQSPREIQSRTLLDSLMGSIGKMIDVSEQLVKNQAALLIYFGKFQKEYTTMMTRVPNLTSGPPGKISLPSVPGAGQTLDADTINGWDLTAFQFGYNKISVEDVLEWGVESCLKNPGQAFTFAHDTLFSFSFSAEVTNGKTTGISVSFGTGNPPDVAGFVPEKIIIPLVNADGTLITNADGTLPTLSDYFTKAGEALKQIFSHHPTEIAALNGKECLTGRFLQPEEGEHASSDALAKAQGDIESRAEQNSLLQQYIANIRSKRSYVQSQASIFKSAMEKSKNSIDQHTNLWTSILEMISSIMHAIFQRAG